MKLRNKLILSCAALAAVATTAVSTTFAWYTSNVDVSASNIQATTASAADNTLLISTSGRQRSWSAKADLAMTAQQTGTLVPVEYDNGNYYTWDLTNNVKSTNAIDWSLSGGQYRDKFLSFMLYFKSGTTDSLKVGWSGIHIVNSTDNLTAKTTLTNTGLTGVSSPTYTVDIMRALRISTNAATSTEVTTGYAAQFNPAQGTQGQEGYVPAATVTRTTYQLESNHHSKTDSLDAQGVSYNAHQYYDEIKGLTGNARVQAQTKGAAGSSETASQLAAVDSSFKFASPILLGETGAGATGSTDSVLAVRIDIYLDGWDTACFDACQGQTFTVALDFSVIQQQQNSGNGQGGNGQQG